MFFEDDWLGRLCAAGQVAPAEAARRLPDQLWAESWVHATRSAGAKQQQHRASRVRYLAVHAVRHHPEAFGLDRTRARPWLRAYEACLHEHLEPNDAAGAEPHRAPELLSTPTLWSAWDRHFGGSSVSLPAAQPETIAGEWGSDELCRRQVARTVLGQTFRLTDTLLHLYFADLHGGQDPARLADGFTDWLSSDDISAVDLRRESEQWMRHLRLILDSSLESAGKGWRQLARQETWPQLFSPAPVLGVTGGSGAHRKATRQFRTPSLPRVIVCTDTLKEGVDLHTFCDRVLHYGVAWTSGDLEQRVGRVDRYFSQIERRLIDEGEPPQVQLQVGYPHVVASLERSQVDRVIQRQRRAEQLMDSPLAGAVHESKELVVGSTVGSTETGHLDPYDEHEFPAQPRGLVAISRDQARKIADHYEAWYLRLLAELEGGGWRVSPDDRRPVSELTLHGGHQQHDLAWSLDADLNRYFLTLSAPPWPDEAGLTGARWRRRRRRQLETESFVRLLVPGPGEDPRDFAIEGLVACLRGAVPEPHANASAAWGPGLARAAGQAPQWLSPNEAEVSLEIGPRRQRVTVYAYQQGLRILGRVARLCDLDPRPQWGSTQIEGNRLREWTREETRKLGLGYLDLHPRDGLVFGVFLLHGELDDDVKAKLVRYVGRRADAWEAALTGDDRW
ncbi:hypothetical protein ENSA5_06510 [Enhygromyxa salina]|uniref:Helicase C-terminal domain-containing protein n=2 Tax=Enhygromyxa salina TaxID=215803 RepID=A0A2S9YHZ9_9BACT|nr:hypothetical protein ENSA5_06510 [Enhygromyxa salina]